MHVFPSRQPAWAQLNPPPPSPIPIHVVHQPDQGVCSNYLCDAKPGDKVSLTGPAGKVMLMPEKTPEADLIMVRAGAANNRLGCFCVWEEMDGDGMSLAISPDRPAHRPTRLSPPPPRNKTHTGGHRHGHRPLPHLRPPPLRREDARRQGLQGAWRCTHVDTDSTDRPTYPLYHRSPDPDPDPT